MYISRKHKYNPSGKYEMIVLKQIVQASTSDEEKKVYGVEFKNEEITIFQCPICRLEKSTAELKNKKIVLKSREEAYNDVRNCIYYHEYTELEQQVEYNFPDFNDCEYDWHSSQPRYYRGSGSAVFTSKEQAERFTKLLNNNSDYYYVYVLEWSDIGEYSAIPTYRVDHDNDEIYTCTFRKKLNENA